jgi:hypothetical protein
MRHQGWQIVNKLKKKTEKCRFYICVVFLFASRQNKRLWMALTHRMLAERFVGPIVHTIFKECMLGSRTDSIAAGHLELRTHTALWSKHHQTIGSKRYAQMLRLAAASMDACHWDDVLAGGCLGGHLDIVHLAIAKGADTYDSGLYYACLNGHLRIAEILISKGARNWYAALSGACERGNRELVKLLISNGACDWESGLHGACRGGHRDLAEWMILNGAADWNSGLVNACQGGHCHIAKWMILKGATDWNWGLSLACFAGHHDIVELLVVKGADRCSHCRRSMSEHISGIKSGKKNVNKKSVVHLHVPCSKLACLIKKK